MTTYLNHVLLFLGLIPVVILAWPKDSQILLICGIGEPWMIGYVVLQVTFSHLIVFSSLFHG